ncbi:ephrin type-A receptor 8-like isoform X1 [Stylophora pistillata]|uniref:ephrin type-A receptor 8-like isoform X1 n=1 Tax=Stylophora pistillata TaxID=50429 RepID=UPI000C056EAA|nr:ephrin type-A receptor 8-like isoform X1 [Stylophora pistillata]
MSLFHTTFVLWLALVLISHEVSGEIETLVEEPGPNLWYWAVFKEISEGFGWSHPSTQSQSYSVCDIASINDEPKNWLRTEYIYIKGATRLNIEVTYDLRNCPLANVMPFCRSNFTLYSYHTDHKLDYNPDPTKLKFQKETVIAPETPLAPAQRTTDTFHGSILTKAKGIYLALLDQGACLTIRKFVVRYRFCSETGAALVKFPRTVAPANNINSTNHEGECTDPHSLKRNNQKIFGVCLSNGEWNITNSSACLCSYGYELTNGSSDSFVCKECQKGFYKDSVGSEKCVPCPENSASNIDRNGCMCNEGYYRSSIVADCEVFVKVINITMVITSESCTDEKYDESSLLARVEEVMEEAFAGRFSGFKSVHLKSSIRCGSITFDLALIFNYKAKEQDVITVLRNASKDGKLGDFIVSTIKETRSQVDFETGNTETGTITPPGSVTGIITGAVVGCVVAIAVAVGIFVFFLWKQRRRKSKKPNNRGFIKASFGP